MIQANVDRPIFVTGAQRSGSSIIARIISLSGGYAGNVSPMYENVNIRKEVDLHYSTMGMLNPTQFQFPLPNTKELLIPINWKDRILHALSQGQVPTEDEIFWMYKGYSLCQVWPIWNYAFPNAKWIIVRRRTGDIVSSCMKTGYMSAFKDKDIQKAVGVSNEQDGWIWWVNEHEKLFIEMIDSGLNCKIIWPERMVNGDYSQIWEMLEWLDLKWHDSIIKTIDPMLWNSKQKDKK